jgi:uridine phosphorylase
MRFYDLQQTSSEATLTQGLQAHAGLDFRPYLVQGSVSLREQVGRGMITGNTVTCPGFYAPQGRKVRIPIRFPSLLGDLGSFHSGVFRFDNFEMESSSYFAFGRLFGHHTASANAIIANRVTREFSGRSHEVVDKLIQAVLQNLS